MKLYIGNVSYDTTERELRDALAAFEPLVDFYYPLDQESGRPRGFAFVTLNDRDTGEEAIREHLTLPPGGLGVQRPDVGITRGRDQRLEIVGDEWAHHQRGAFQGGLKIERIAHGVVRCFGFSISQYIIH